jgi:putative SOS response-associated peptidase YedK
MCGRFTETKVDPGLIAARFGVLESAVPAETLGRFNVCPTEPVLAVCGSDGGEPVAGSLRWGLVPPWARALGAGYEPINARAETVTSKRPFAALMERPERRCLVVADGWYEWLRQERPRGARSPFRYTVDGGDVFAFAALWDERRVGGAVIASATILTTNANGVCASVHDRMPCVLGSAEAEAAWLSPHVDAAAACDLLQPLVDARTSAGRANPAVNRAGVEGPELLAAPAAEDPSQLRLV